jgi:hypothetical protein
MPAAAKTTTKKDTNTKRKNVPTNGTTPLDSTDTSDKIAGGKPDKKVRRRAVKDKDRD